MSAEQRQGALQLQAAVSAGLVAASGPLANFLLAIVLLTGLSLYAGHTVIARHRPGHQGQPAARPGIKPATGHPSIARQITDFQQLPEIISVSGGSDLAYRRIRGRQDVTVQVTPRL
jgi:membrane-associated protease RseP (regulator of RpoE activity)